MKHMHDICQNSDTQQSTYLLQSAGMWSRQWGLRVPTCKLLCVSVWRDSTLDVFRNEFLGSLCSVLTKKNVLLGTRMYQQGGPATVTDST